MIELKLLLNKLPLWSGIPYVLSVGVPIFETGQEFIGGELAGLSGKLITAGKHIVLVELSTVGMELRFSVDSKYLMRSSTKLAVA